MRRQISLSLLQIAILLIIFFMTIELLLFACHCDCGLSEPINTFVQRGSTEIDLRHRDAKLHTTNCGRANASKTEIKLRNAIEELEKRIRIQDKLDKVIISQDISFLKRKGSQQTLRSYTPKNEYDVIPFDALTLSAVYGSVGFLSKNPAETVSGRRGVEHSEIIRFAVNAFNEDVESKSDPVLPIHMAEGIMRNDRLVGTVYELHFRSDIPDVFKRIKIMRPFGALEKVGKIETIDTSKEIINVIVPLSGRVNKFEEFMERFVEVGIRYDRRVFLTVIVFGADGRDKIRTIINRVSKDEKFTKYKVIFTDQDFSRGAALQKGAESWSGGNVILFFCDVDIYFTNDFLERCRLYTSPGKRVYYPIVFSQYNPVIVYGGQTIPPLRQQMKLNKDSGFWRDFGFGMTCQYRDDFFKIGGFDLSIKGWGMEDVRLYKKYLQSDLVVVRAYDRSIFHIYHEKKCSRHLSDDQFVSCLQSKAVSEGSHKQMGMLAFGKFLLGNDQPDWGKLLEASLTAAVDNGASDKDQSRPMENGREGTSKIGAGKAPQPVMAGNEPHLKEDFHVQMNTGAKSKEEHAKEMKLADDILTHAFELKSLHDDLSNKLRGHPQEEHFKMELQNLFDFYQKLQKQASETLGGNA